MALESRLELKLAQKLILTPQLQMAIKLLQMPQLELSQTINQELVENPFLEEATDWTDDEEKTSLEKDESDPSETFEDQDDSEMPLERLINSQTDDYFEERSYDGRDLGYFTPGTVTKPSFEYFLSSSTDLPEYLLWQLRMSREPEHIRGIAELIIGNIDENGYLGITVEELKDTAQADEETVIKALELVQGFDPPGVAARDIRECLLLQLRALNLGESLTEKIISSNLDLLGKRKYAELARMYGVALDEICASVRIIEGLVPKPASSFSSSAANYIVPDVFIVKSDEGFQIVLNDEGLPKLRISHYYHKLLSQRNAVSKEDRQFLDEKFRSAVWLMKSLDQRNKTIYRVTESLLQNQINFFHNGVGSLRPLNLKDVATELNLHESTISRVTSNKYLACSHGIFSFKYFFSNAIPTDSGDELSSTTVKDMIRTIISEEDPGRPLSDMKIADIFKNKNIAIARRTIAKYREELKIPSQSQRKRLPMSIPPEVTKGGDDEHNS